MTPKRSLLETMTEHLDLPKDLMLCEPIVTITGRSEMLIENYSGILNFDTDRIRLSLKHGQLLICGKDLRMEYYTNADMKITGTINRIQYTM